MSRGSAFLSCGVAGLAVFAMSGSAAAAPARITGKLSKPGYTVIALASNGKATSVRAGRGKFRLAPPAGRVTLHLRTPNGKYAGPVVVGRKGGRAIVGVKAGARLGRINILAAYAKVARRVPRRWLDTSRQARAKRGVPIGAGVFGRVLSRHARGPKSDRDLDGIPNVFDIDDDGDRILDSFERQKAVRKSQNGAPGFQMQTSLSVGLEATGNANAPGLPADKVDAALPFWGRLDLEVKPGAELDCGRPQQRTDPTVGGLIYCTTGGTGELDHTEAPPYPQFPEAFDTDNDGFANLRNTGPSPEGTPFMGIFPGAGSSQIGTGDLLIECVPGCGEAGASEYAATLGYMFATVPALKSWDDGQGDAGTPTYPALGHQGPECGLSPLCSVPGAGGPDPGVRGNPFVVKRGPNGQVVLRLTFWRPQRRPIAGEPGFAEPPTGWIDIGRLNYTASIADVGTFCSDPDAFSEDDPYTPGVREDDPNLVPVTSTIAGTNNARGFADSAPDQPANPGHTFTYSLNLNKCFASAGLPAWQSGEERGIEFMGLAPASGDDASQHVFFKLQ